MSKLLSRSTIPLRCTLCPKNPQFSDISHLLTHISSKGHLSHRFKLQIRCQSDPSARTQLETYNIWYADNGLEELLSERLQSKEQKNSAKRVRGALKPGPKPRAKAGKKKENAVDFAQQLKDEAHQNNRAPATPRPRPAVPRMHLWNTQPLGADSPFESEPSSRWEQGDGYATPTMRRYMPNFPERASSEEDAEGDTQPSSSPIKSGEAQATGDSSKLKGICWPGMDLFDSATAEMKRMRNQKKDGSILRRMKNTSRDVLPNEVCYFPMGEVHRVKDIYESSPEPSPASSRTYRTVQTKTQSRRPRKTKTQPALKDVSTNLPLGQNHHNGKRVLRDSVRLQSSYDGSQEKNMLSGYGMDRFLKRAGADDEMAMTAGTYGKKQKMGVYRDEEERSPGRTESPLPEHKFDLPPAFAPDHAPAHRMMHFSPPAPQRPGNLRLFSDKENFQSDYQQRRDMGADSGLPPHAFHTQNSNPLFYNTHTNYGYSYGYNDSPPTYQTEMRPAPPVYQNDFKPLMMQSPYRDPTAPQNYHHEQSGFTNPFYMNM